MHKGSSLQSRAAMKRPLKSHPHSSADNFIAVSFFYSAEAFALDRQNITNVIKRQTWPFSSLNLRHAVSSRLGASYRPYRKLFQCVVITAQTRDHVFQAGSSSRSTAETERKNVLAPFSGQITACLSVNSCFVRDLTRKKTVRTVSLVPNLK